MVGNTQFDPTPPTTLSKSTSIYFNSPTVCGSNRFTFAPLPGKFSCSANGIECECAFNMYVIIWNIFVLCPFCNLILISCSIFIKLCVFILCYIHCCNHYTLRYLHSCFLFLSFLHSLSLHLFLDCVVFYITIPKLHYIF